MVDLSLDYGALIGGKSRNMIRKVQSRGYEFGPFDYNRHLSDIYAINTSKPKRQGRQMTQAYTQSPRPIAPIDVRCLRHQVVYIGGLKDGVLRAYSHLVICNDLAILNRFIGHRDSLSDGVMNGLMNEIVFFARNRGCRWLNYLRMSSASDGLTAFKESVGFRPVKMEFVL